MKIKKIFMLVILSIFGMSIFAQTINHNVGYTKVEWGTSLDNVKKTYKLKEIPNDSNWSFMYEGFKGSVKIYEATNKKDSVVDTLYFFFNDDKLFMARDILKKSVKDFSALTKRYGSLEINSSGDYWNRTLDKDNYIIQSIRIYKSKSGNYVAQMYNRKLYSSALITPLAERKSTGIVDDLKKLSNKLIQDVSGKPTYAFLALTSDDGNALVENYVTDALTEAMFNTGKIKIVERASIEKVLREQKFQDSALVNENTASEIGNLTGANYVCYGTVKDLGNQITLNVKVVEVSTAELCSMGRETVAKDEYLKGAGFESHKTSGAKKGTTGAKKSNVQSQWKVSTVRNDFDGCTVYTITCTSTDKAILYFCYEKRDNKIDSHVKAGVIRDPSKYTDHDSEIDIKLDSGSPIYKKLSNWSFYWYLKTGTQEVSDKADKVKFFAATNVSDTKDFFNYFSQNNYITIRSKRYDEIHNFQTEGFLDVLAANGITEEEILATLDNEAF